MSDQVTSVTPEQLEAEIVGERYFTAADGVVGNNQMVDICEQLGEPTGHRQRQDLSPHDLNHLTFCVLVLRNGCKVVGVNHGPVDPSGFDEAYGRKDAREDAIRQLWPLLGFRLRDRLERRARDLRVLAELEREED